MFASEVHRMKDILTTTDVARLLGLHANTLKNWVRDGKIPSFRTLGGHYRIRASELAAALREHGIPVPPELEGEKKRIFVVHPEPGVRDTLERNLEPMGAVSCFESGAEALMEMGSRRPNFIIWNACQSDVDTVSMINAARRDEKLQGIDIVLIRGRGADMPVIPDEMKNVPVFGYPENLVELLDRMRAASK
jgi:excisionase family DNA binding protein